MQHYLGPRRTCKLEDSCALQSLASEVARSGDIARVAFEKELRTIAKLIVAGPTSRLSPKTVDEAIAALAILVGAVTLSRAVHAHELGDQIASAAQSALLGKKV